MVMEWHLNPEWNAARPTWKWLFVHMDKDKNSQLDRAEHQAFQDYKKEHLTGGKSWKLNEALNLPESMSCKRKFRSISRIKINRGSFHPFFSLFRLLLPTRFIKRQLSKSSRIRCGSIEIRALRIPIVTIGYLEPITRG